MSDMNDRLSEIRARVEAATHHRPGAIWVTDYDVSEEYTGARVIDSKNAGWDGVLVADVHKDADATFIAHARQDVPALLAALEAVVAMHRSAGEGRGEPNPIFGTHWLCASCDDIWPCRTITAAADALGGVV